VAALRAAERHAVVVEDDQTAVLRVWARRYHDLSSARTQLVCRLHAVLSELVPGGFPSRISTGQAAVVLASLSAGGAADAARIEVANVLLEDLRRIDQQRGDTRGRLTRMVVASSTSLTDIYGVGPIIAATVLGLVGDIGRFPSREHFAAYNGTAPIEVSSGNRRIYRLSRRGNRQLNHAIHMAAVSQIRYRGTMGRIYYETASTTRPRTSTTPSSPRRRKAARPGQHWSEPATTGSALGARSSPNRTAVERRPALPTPRPHAALPNLKPAALPAAIKTIRPIFEDARRYIDAYFQPLPTLGVSPTLATLQAHWRELQDTRKAYLEAPG
jgi:hypothetical protein